jgi:hypothetical protein
MGQHGQGDVSVPALPVADFIVVQPALALGGLEACSICQRFPATITRVSSVVFRVGAMTLESHFPEQKQVNSYLTTVVLVLLCY